ncbi:MAG TPA: flagellar biosynthetic protein FliR [Longimicrobiaceae bacterium]|nr:flagellar biosynthetic protein FliR [Longimicrobiaceae bacterium]
MNHTTDLLNSAAATTLVLFAFRLGGLVLIAPVFSAKTVPMKLRVVLIVLFTWLLAPAVVIPGAAPALTFGTAATETLVGFAIGFGAAVFVGAIEAAGDLISISSGLSGAELLDPLTGIQSGALAQFANFFAIAVLLAVNAHILMLRALTTSVELIPVGSAVDVQPGLARLVSLGSTLFLLGLRFAAPVLAVVLLGNVALAILARVAPQVNALSVAFPLQIGISLFALATAVPIIGAFYAGWQGSYESVVMNLLGAFAGAGAR